MNLGKMDINLLPTMDPRNKSSVNDGQFQLGCEHTVNTAFSCSGVNQRVDASDASNRYTARC